MAKNQEVTKQDHLILHFSVLIISGKIIILIQLCAS
jgi:hypothetical protein